MIPLLACAIIIYVKKRKVLIHILISCLLLAGLSACKGSNADANPPGIETSQPSNNETTPLTGKVADHKIIHELWDGKIPEANINIVKQKLQIAYGHTSHGSQITTGMNGLNAFANAGNLSTTYSQDLFHFNSSGTDEALAYLEGVLGGDVGYYPAWVNETQTFIDNDTYNDYNVIMWSWCGQASSRTEQTMIDTYLKLMSDFETANPEITFIYMTGHLDGTGVDGNLNQRNEQIRKHCHDNDSWLFDFADIESYDPDGNYYLDKNGNDACSYSDGNWATAWQNNHTENIDWYDCGGAHTESINSNMKAYATWWLFVQIAKDI